MKKVTKRAKVNKPPKQIQMFKEKLVTVHLQVSLHKQARMYALESEQTLTQLIEKALIQYLASQAKPTA
jgi:predicted HicB family RNase H-like nuclease